MYQRDEERVNNYRAKISTIEKEIADLKRRYLFQEIFDSVRDIERKLSRLVNDIRTVRQKGFVYGKDWENTVTDYNGELPGLKAAIQTESNNISNANSFVLNQTINEIASLHRDFETNPSNYYSYVDSMESKITPIKKIISDAENKLKAMIQPMEEKLNKLSARIERVNDGFEYLEKATFKLLVGENLIDVWGAQYLKEGKKGPKGIIFLTDKRFRFEQNEDVVVSRRFLVVTKKEHIQKLLIDEPIGLISSSKDTEKGIFLVHKEMLNLEFERGAKIRKAIFRTNIDSKEVDNILDSVISGGIERDVTSESKERKKEEKPLPKIDKCPACGASFDRPIVKGMTHIKCKYCGKIINF